MLAESGYLWYGLYKSVQLHCTEGLEGTVTLVIAGRSNPFRAQGGTQGSFFSSHPILQLDSSCASTQNNCSVPCARLPRCITSN